MRENTYKRVISLSLSKPSLADNTADADRLVAALKKELGADAIIHIDLDLLRQIPDLLRKWEYDIRCIVFKEKKRHILLGLTSAQENRTVAGLAVDLGTTRVVLCLLDLATGEVLGETAFNNPQITIAPDILARIHFADTPNGLEKLQQMVIAALNSTVAELCASCGLRPEDIYLITLAGNTAMTHLFMGITPHWMIREPYIPAVNCPGLLRTSELGIQAGANARIFIFPNVGSYFGGDLIAGILYSGMNQKEETAILVDVGTNAEVILGNRDWLVACAGAAGPALESGVARMGMLAGPGVIDTVEVDRQTREFKYRTIDDLPPKGMCGSGIIDLAAQLFLSGMLDIRGKLVPEKCGNRLMEKDGMPFIVVVPAKESVSGEDLGMSQADIDSLIRSKAAMYTILRTITRTVGMEPEDLQTFYVAGTFGSFIKPQSAIAIGMIPDLPLERYKPLGNSSLGGATMALTMEDCMEETEKIRNRITYMELNVNQELMIRFSASRFLPHTDPARFPSVKVWG
ncbi:MAG: ASKHA domain-containing protein [Desulfococcaceae bacterium]